jgi:hypothetical protein
MMGIQKKFLVPFGAPDRAIHDRGMKTQFLHGAHHPLTSSLVEWRLANDAALAHLALPNLKLRLDQYNHLTVLP